MSSGGLITDIDFMRHALELARRAHEQNEVPVGALVVLEGEVIGEGWNQPIAAHDPTAHAEMVAIREACRKLQSFELPECEIYTSCEPCPMCLGAIYWARPARVYFANSAADAAQAGFDDAFIYQELRVPHAERQISMIQLRHDDAPAAFRAWREKSDKIRY